LKERKKGKGIPQLRKRLDYEKIKTEYFDNHKSSCQISNEIGHPRCSIRAAIKRMGLSLRSTEEAMDLKREYIYDPDFFKSWTPEMAWTFGILITDGCLVNQRKNTSLVLSMKDLDVIEKVLYHLKSNARINIVKPKSDYHNVQYKFNLYGAELIRNLRALGMTERKSLTVNFADVPQSVLRHFLRGCYDGNGCFHVLKRRPENIISLYTSASVNFIRGIQNALVGLGLPEKRIIVVNRAGFNDYYVIRYNHRDTINLLRILYEDSTSNTRMNRKFELAERFV
jgi:hypothetical protein